jgi:hypothetical protein
MGGSGSLMDVQSARFRHTPRGFATVSSFSTIPAAAW